MEKLLLVDLGSLRSENSFIDRYWVEKEWKGKLDRYVFWIPRRTLGYAEKLKNLGGFILKFMILTPIFRCPTERKKSEKQCLND